MVRKADIPRVAVDAALELAATNGWGATSLGDIAEAAGISLADLRRAYPSKIAILNAFAARIDEAVLSDLDPDVADKPAYERLFDVLMKRFDALNPHKEAVRSMLRASSCDAEALVFCGSLSLRRSMRWMLEAADLDSSGLRGALRIKGLSLLYLSVMRVWLTDETEDMARTMAALDRRLRRIDRMMGVFARTARRGSEPGEPVEAGAG